MFHWAFMLDNTIMTEKNEFEEELSEFNIFSRKPSAEKLVKGILPKLKGAVSGRPGETETMTVVPIYWDGGKKHMLVGVDKEKGPFFKYRAYKSPTSDPEWFKGIMSNMDMTASTGGMFSSVADLFSQLSGTSAMETNESSEDVITESENEPTDPDLWSRAIRGAKDKYDVYPSAYANAFASKWYKEKGGGWRKKSKNEMSEGSVHKDSGLGKWFGEDWVDVSRKEDGKHPECGDSSDSGSRGKDGKRAYPKCVPKSKAKKMSKKEKESATRRKRDKGKPKGGKPQNVSTDKNESINEIFKSWDLSLIEGSTKDDKDKKKKDKTAKDPVFGIAMTWPASDFFGYGHEEDEEDSDFVPDSGGVAVDFGDSGSGVLFDAGQMGVGTVGGE